MSNKVTEDNNIENICLKVFLENFNNAYKSQNHQLQSPSQENTASEISLAKMKASHKIELYNPNLLEYCQSVGEELGKLIGMIQ